ncbi:hypothetical protein [Flavobacterium panacagri]|uniref:hypothetical protein n=1 Tax=Flavobacterium panacagri TaxID=3034146 RepID=UPI0025A4CFE1|nr:hypothetical protein [Flavobacterium panacagri]
MITFLTQNVFYKKLTSELTEIELTQNGFIVDKPFGSKPKAFDWNEIQNIYFSQNKKEVIIEISNKQIVLKNSNIGWYEFIQNVPSKFASFDFNYVKTFMQSLQPCEVCGIIAVTDKVCIVCENVPWDNEKKKNKSEYLKAKQLKLFSPLLKAGKPIKQHAEPEHGFQADKNWKLYI